MRKTTTASASKRGKYENPLVMVARQSGLPEGGNRQTVHTLYQNVNVK